MESSQQDVKDDGGATESSQQDVKEDDGAPPSSQPHERQDVEEDDEGPPPGWTPPPASPVVLPEISDTIMEIEHDIEDEGPSTGEHSVLPPQTPLETPPSIPVVPSDVKMECEDDDTKDQEEGSPQALPSAPSDIKIEQPDVENEEERLPSGLPQLESQPPLPAEQPQVKQVPSDIKMESEQQEVEAKEEGPPPGCNSEAPNLSPLEVAPSDIKMESEQQDVEDEEEGPPPGWDSKQPPLPTPSPKLEVVPSDIKTESEPQQIEEEGPPPGWDSKPPPQPQPQPLLPKESPPAAAVTSDKSQLICGSCRRLLSYPRGAKYVKCSCCETVNLVLEAQQVGQVKCGNCTVLLMYPYGAPAVRCSSCRFVTEIGAFNKRPPLSAQQGRQPSLSNTIC